MSHRYWWSVLFPSSGTILVTGTVLLYQNDTVFHLLTSMTCESIGRLCEPRRNKPTLTYLMSLWSDSLFPVVPEAGEFLLPDPFGVSLYVHSLFTQTLLIDIGPRSSTSTRCSPLVEGGGGNKKELRFQGGEWWEVFFPGVHRRF